MDAKPQRPRATRVHDENAMPISAAAAAIAGKTLHQRTKSTPAFSTLMQQGAVKAANKKVLGEVNANMKVLPISAKDDSALAKKPAQVSVQELVKPNSFAQPATRPLAPKSVSNGAVPTTTSTMVSSTARLLVVDKENIPELAQVNTKKVAAKKSTAVLKDNMTYVEPIAEIKKPVPTAPVHQRLSAPRQRAQTVASPQQFSKQVTAGKLAQASQVQEVRKTENIPLREEPVPRAIVPLFKPANAPAQVAPLLAQQCEAERESLRLLELEAKRLDLDCGVVPHNVQELYEEDEQYYYAEEGFTTARSFGFTTGGVTTVLTSEPSETASQEIAVAKAFVESTRTQEDIEDEAWDTSMVAEYGEEIFAYMRRREIELRPNPHYMDFQQEIQWSMRCVLMDWLIQVHARFTLLPETLFLSVNFVDRFLSCKVVSLNKLQLVGATAIFVAAKYEEVNCPSVQEIIYMVDNGYSVDEVLKAERFMLTMLQFELGWPGPMSFLRRISKADDYDLETRTLAKYFLEVMIMDERFVACDPSMTAAGAHCMARMMLHKGDWSPAHVFYSNYTYTQLHQLLAILVECCEDPQRHHAAVFDKYTDKRYKRASSYVAGEMANGFQLLPIPSGNSKLLGNGDDAQIWPELLY